MQAMAHKTSFPAVIFECINGGSCAHDALSMILFPSSVFMVFPPFLEIPSLVVSNDPPLLCVRLPSSIFMGRVMTSHLDRCGALLRHHSFR